MKRLETQRTSITLIVIISCFCLFTLSVLAQPSPPCIFYGYVTIGGMPAPDYLNVTAVIAGTSLSWSTVTKNGTYGWPLKSGASMFQIPSQDPDDTTKNGGANGDFIQFYVNGTQADQTSVFDSSGAYEVDLSIAGSIPEQPTLTVSINCSTTYPNYKVEISGRLVSQNGNGIARTNLAAAYSTVSDQSWKSIGSFNSTPTGDYNVEWIPASTGSYTIKVSWGGSPDMNPTEAYIYVTTLPVEEKYVLSVISNSTISNLAFNSTKRILSFTLDGPSGTTGYADITIAKDLITDPNGIKMYLDDSQTDYAITPSSTSSLLHLTYQQSTHDVAVDLDLSSGSVIGTPLIFSILVVVIVILIAIIYVRQKKVTAVKIRKQSKVRSSVSKPKT